MGAVAGLPALAVAGVAVAGYGLGAAVAALTGRRPGRRGRRRERIDPFTLGEPWRSRVQAALGARRRYDEALQATADGPLRERLADIGERIDDGVTACWRIANQGNALRQGVRTIGIGELRSKLAGSEAAAQDDPASEPRLAALRAQLGSAERIEATAADADARLALLTARLDEAAARAVELSLGAGTGTGVAGLDADVDDVVDQLEALRLALDEVEG